jgi:uncharacterized membrane-anchored protein
VERFGVSAKTIMGRAAQMKDATGGFALIAALLLAVSIALPRAASAQGATPAPDPRAEIQAAVAAADQARKQGPVELIDQAILRLPSGFSFIPAAESARLMRAIGNRPGSNLVGLVVGDQGLNADWFVVLQFEKSDYIKDDDAKDWNVDELLAGLREGTEQANAERRARGIPEMEVVGWVQRPTYDSAYHRLVWSASTKDKNSPADAAHGVNYNTCALGRDGYFSLNLVTDLATVEQTKPTAHRLLAALEYRDGKRYADFNAGTDKVAEYGIGALIAGAAAKKLGLFAAIGVFLLKFWKIVALAAVVLAGGAFKLFRGRSRQV